MCYLLRGLSFYPVCNSKSLHYNIPLWYSAPGDYDVIDSAHPRLEATRVADCHLCQVTKIAIHCRYQTCATRQECLRLNFGVTVSSGQLDQDQAPPSAMRRRCFSNPVPMKERVSFRGLRDERRSRENLLEAVSYSVVVPEGQDPGGVFVGWTTAGFRYVSSQFQNKSERGAESNGMQYGQQVKIVQTSTNAKSPLSSKYSTAFMVCLADLLTSPVEPRLSLPVK